MGCIRVRTCCGSWTTAFATALDHLRPCETEWLWLDSTVMLANSNLIARGIVVASVCFTLTHVMSAEPFTPNYDESKVPPYTLPDALVMADGRKVADAKMWQA